MTLIINILIVVIAIGFVIFIHELGHFFVAKLFGVHIEKFSIGFGKELFGWTKKETRYSLSVFPLGGFVKMQGENIFENTTIKSDGSDSNIINKNFKKGDFINLKYWQRICVVSAGALMNIFFALFLVFSISFVNGVYRTDTKDLAIGDLLENYPAVTAGLQKGDVLQKIAGKKIVSWDDVVDFSLNHDGGFVDIEVLRGNQKLVFNLQPAYESKSKRYILGVSSKIIHERLSFFGSINFVYQYFKKISFGFFLTLKSLIFNQSSNAEIIGPIGVVNELTEAINQGFLKFLFLLGIISFNLGLINLLPLPILDGGHILLYLFQGITKIQVSQKFLEVSASIMFILLIALMIFVTNKDILRIFKEMK